MKYDKIHYNIHYITKINGGSFRTMFQTNTKEEIPNICKELGINESEIKIDEIVSHCDTSWETEEVRARNGW